jgi:dTDP-4-dehydrorhamnose reductase
MTDSFSINDTGLVRLGKGERRNVLITGAGGMIGPELSAFCREHYRLRLMVQRQADVTPALTACGEVVVCDLSNADGLKEHCRGIDTVVHLAADSNPSSLWSDLLKHNIVGTYNLFTAAKAAGCRRVIFASSIHAISGYPVDTQVREDDPVNPGDLYGVSKCFGEALGRYMAEQEDVSVIVIRIGLCRSLAMARAPEGAVMLDSYFSPRDFHQLVHRAIEVESLRFGIFHGVSDGRFKRMDITDGRTLLGYAPVDDISEINPEVAQLRLRERANEYNLRAGPDQISGIRDDAMMPEGAHRQPPA